MSIKENTIEVGSLKWFYQEAEAVSDKPPVLLLHALPAHSYSWCGILPSLASQGYRALAPDWLGFGLSDKPDTREFKYTPDAYIEALAALLVAWEINKFSLVVQGFLGSVGIQYALRYPEQIERLIILNSPLCQEDKLPWQIQQLGLPLIGDMLTQDPLLVDRTLEKGSGFVISDRDLEIYRKPFLKSSGAGRSLLATIKNLQLATAMAEIESGLANWSQETLIIWGMADPWLSSTFVENLAKNKGNIELLKLEEAKHYPQEHWLQEITPAILNFLRRQSF